MGVHWNYFNLEFYVRPEAPFCQERLEPVLKYMASSSVNMQGHMHLIQKSYQHV